jgi:hypothetical protein
MTEGALLTPNRVIRAVAGNITVPSGETLPSHIHGIQTETFLMTS